MFSSSRTAHMKSRLARAKRDMWHSLLVWGRRHKSDPVNYRISPNNHCVNHNYMGPVQLLTMKTIAAPRSKRSLHLSKGALRFPRRPDAVSRARASLSVSQSRHPSHFQHPRGSRSAAKYLLSYEVLYCGSQLLAK